MAEKVKKLEILGDRYVENEQFNEAILHYTHAINIDKEHYDLFDKRCYAFFKIKQYYYAYEDAKQLIQLRPTMINGYLKKALIEYKTGNYFDALNTYSECSHLDQDQDLSINEAVSICHSKIVQQKIADQQIPWIAASLGLVLGIILVIIDYIIYVSSGYLAHPFMKLMMIVATASMSFGLVRAYRNYIRYYRRMLIKPGVTIQQLDQNLGNESQKKQE